MKGKWGNIYAGHSKKKKEIREQIKAQLPETFTPSFCPIKFSIVHYGKIAKKRGNSGTHGLRKGDSHTEEPDFSNVVKLLEDCMSGIIYNDDKQVCGFVEPMDHIVDEKDPRTEIIIYEYK